VLAVAWSEECDQGKGEGGGEGVLGVCPHGWRGSLAFVSGMRSREEHFTEDNHNTQSYVLDTLIAYCLR
jgi:hypothetical protein